MKSWPSNVAQWENNCLSPNPSNPPASLSLPLPVSLSLSLSTPRPYFFPLSEGKEWEELEKKQGPEKAAIWENTLGAEKPACCRRPRNTMSCIMRCSGAVLGRALTVALGSEALVSPRLNEAPWGDAESENQRETSNLFHSPGRDNQRCGSVNLPSRNATKKEGAPRDSKIASCHNSVMWSVMIIEGVGFHTVILELAEHFRVRLHGKHLFGTKSAVEGTYSRSSMRCLTILEKRRWQIGPWWAERVTLVHFICLDTKSGNMGVICGQCSQVQQARRPFVLHTAISPLNAGNWSDLWLCWRHQSRVCCSRPERRSVFTPDSKQGFN